ncbi:MAG: hypothetical protein MI924_31125 [Chloroflexales bacterium]|nr:hypothetical protein [Chloroflexales bacterium]
MVHKFSRKQRWVGGGALIGLVSTILLGWLFTVFFVFADPSSNLPDSFISWLALLGWTALFWGLVGIVLGAILGHFASLLWSAEGKDR